MVYASWACFFAILADSLSHFGAGQPRNRREHSAAANGDQQLDTGYLVIRAHVYPNVPD